MIQHISKTKDKNYTIISKDAEKALDRIQHPFMIKTLHKVGMNGTYLNTIKANDNKPTAIILNGKKLKASPQRLGTKQEYPLSSFLFNIVLKVQGATVRQGKKGIEIGRKGIKLSLFADDIIPII